MSTYIKISKPAYDIMHKHMRNACAKHCEGWAKNVHDVLRRRGGDDRTVKVEVSRAEASSMGKIASDLKHRGSAMEKFGRHLRNKGVFFPEDLAAGRQTDEEVAASAAKKSRSHFVAEQMDLAEERGENVDDAHDWANQYWAKFHKERHQKKMAKKGKSPESAVMSVGKGGQERDLQEILDRRRSGKNWFYLTKAQERQAWVDQNARLEAGNYADGFTVRITDSLFEALKDLPVHKRPVLRAMREVRPVMWFTYLERGSKQEVDVDEVAAFGALAEEVLSYKWPSKAAKRDAKKLKKYADKVKRSL